MARKRVIVLTADTTLSKNQSGSLIVFNAVAGVVATLPAGGTGLNYEFVVRTDNSSATYTINAGSNSMAGFAIVASGAGSTYFLSDVTLHLSTDLTARVVSMASAGSGGLCGSKIKVVCDEQGVWNVEAFCAANAGAILTPFGVA